MSVRAIDQDGDTLIEVSLDTSTVLLIKPELINTIVRYQTWVRKHEHAGWITPALVDELYHFLAELYSWP